jgi:hypothetical protein
MSIDQSALDDLQGKLAALDLTAEQRSFLDAIQKIAWDLACAQTSVDAEFDGSFAPGEAEMIMAYHGATSANSITRSITGPSSTTSITRAVQP